VRLPPGLDVRLPPDGTGCEAVEGLRKVFPLHVSRGRPLRDAEDCGDFGESSKLGSHGAREYRRSETSRLPCPNNVAASLLSLRGRRETLASRPEGRKARGALGARGRMNGVRRGTGA
jgi:hypothetical protein